MTAVLFDENGTLRDAAYVPRIEKFGKELIWMARVVRHGRERIPSHRKPNGEKPRLPRCGSQMNRHAVKVDATRAGSDPGFDGVLQEFHTCPRCRCVLERHAG